MIRRPPRSTPSDSSAASDVYKRQLHVVTKHRADIPVLCGCFPLAIYRTFGSVYMSMPLPRFVTAYPSPSPHPQVHSLVGLCLYSYLTPRFFMTFFFLNSIYMGSPGGAVLKNLPANAEDTGSSPGPGRSHMPQSNQARAPQLLSLCSRAREPQLLKLAHS